MVIGSQEACKLCTGLHSNAKRSLKCVQYELRYELNMNTVHFVAICAKTCFVFCPKVWCFWTAKLAITNLAAASHLTLLTPLHLKRDRLLLAESRQKHLWLGKVAKFVQKG